MANTVRSRAPSRNKAVPKPAVRQTAFDETDLSVRRLSTRDREKLADAVASVPSFHNTLARVYHFPTTVFLDPEPASPRTNRDRWLPL